MAQRDPLVEYQREGFLMFQTMMESIREESIGMLFNIEVETRQAPEMSLPGVVDGRSVTTEPVLNTPGLEAPARPATLRYTAPEESGEASTHIERTPGAAAPKAAGGNNKKKKGKRR
jgi:preprotein translocase subunit SecA